LTGGIETGNGSGRDVDGGNVDGSLNAKLDGMTVYGKTLKAGMPWPAPIGNNTQRARSISDVALEYWAMPLNNNSKDPILTTPDDPATWMHINFVGMGFGIKGTLDHKSPKVWADLKSGARMWPKLPPFHQQIQTNNSVVDDLWHANVNGFAPNEGALIAETSPKEFQTAFEGLLQDVMVVGNSRSGLAFSNPNVTDGKQFTYTAKFYTNWGGEVVKKRIDAQGNESTSVEASTNAYFSAIDNRAAWAKSRKVFTFDVHGVDLSPQASKLAADVVNYLRGDDTLEGTKFRKRRQVLGDIVNAKPLVVAEPFCLNVPVSSISAQTTVECAYDEYENTGYDKFFQRYEKRDMMVYVAANDGMLHAFNADLEEQWAYMPAALFRAESEQGIINLTKANNFQHYYYMDATPVMQDVQFGVDTPDNPEGWHTVLVGGLGKGGKAFYALDVTDADPKVAANKRVLWEYSDAKTMGYSFGEPIITKTNATVANWMNHNGSKKWTAILSSGYNNQDGRGYLNLVDVESGTLLTQISLPGDNGTKDSPTNLVYVSGYIESGADQLVTAAYGADEKGNLWRFNLESSDPSKWQADKLAEFRNNGGAQYVTTDPTYAVVNDQRWVMIGTGGFRNDNDLNNTGIRNTFYTLPDGDLESAKQGGQPLTRGNLVSLSESGINGNLSNHNGWYMDFEPGYHANVKPVAISNVVAYAVNKYEDSASTKDPCKTGAFTGKLYIRDIATGNSLLKGSSEIFDKGIASIDLVKTVDSNGKEHLGFLVKSMDADSEARYFEIKETGKGKKADFTPERVNIRSITKQ
jgi:type IV pilus assembly protein PilY1